MIIVHFWILDNFAANVSYLIYKPEYLLNKNTRKVELGFFFGFLTFTETLFEYIYCCIVFVISMLC